MANENLEYIINVTLILKIVAAVYSFVEAAMNGKKNFQTTKYT